MLACCCKHYVLDGQGNCRCRIHLFVYIMLCNLFFFVFAFMLIGSFFIHSNSTLIVLPSLILIVMEQFTNVAITDFDKS
jgi:hypothetical protein